MAKILVIDDDRAVRKTISITLKRAGYDVQEARNGEDGVKLIERNIYDVLLCDLRMQGIDGLEVLRHSKRVFQDIEVIIMTAYGTIDNAVEAMKNGAYEYLTKPFKSDELLITVEKALEHNQLRMRVRMLERGMQEQYGVDTIITANQEMRNIIKNALAVANTDSNVLITGESGTGKELVAGVIHNRSPYADKPFIPVNCGGLPEQLLESELFGHVRGAFTGAITNKRGLVEEADGGTLFLDEVAETSPTLQVKLLRFIQNGEIRRVGSNENKQVKVRIIAATNKDLQVAMQNSEFREDLYYRISVIPLHLPPLRERQEDIPILAQHFLKMYAEKFGKSIEAFTSDALNALTQYKWPGNIRELMNAVEHGVALSPTRELGVSHLPQRILHSLEFLLDSDSGTPTLADVEKSYILKVLGDTHWNQKRAGKILGLSKTTLYRRLKAYNIQPKQMIQH